MQNLLTAIKAVILIPFAVLMLSGFGLGDIFGGGISEKQYSLGDLGLGFLASGNLSAITSLGGFNQIAGGNAELLRKSVTGMDATSFFSEYGVAGKDPIKYNQVGMEQIDRLWREGARVTAAAQFGRKLVSRVTANLIKMNQTAAIGAEIAQSEQEVMNGDDDTQATVRAKILAKLKEKKDQIDVKQREALIRMNVAALGAAICALNASQALPAAISSIGGAGAELAQLPGKFMSNPLEAAKVPGIISGTQNLIESINKLSKDLPAFVKNVQVLFAALSELSGGSK